MNAALVATTVTGMRTVATLLVLMIVPVRKGSLEMDIHVQVFDFHVLDNIKVTDDGGSMCLVL